MELFGLLATAKEAGFDLGTMTAIIMIYFKLRSDLKKALNEARPTILQDLKALIKSSVDEQMDKVVAAIEGHNKRIDNLETRVDSLKKMLDNDANR